jgi:PAS domain-containing protein
MATTTDSILESISDGVFTVDLNWCITAFNRAAEEITGILRQKGVVVGNMEETKQWEFA